MEFIPKDNIAQYLSGELSESEYSAFISALAVDPDLQHAVNVQQRIEDELSERAEIEALLRSAEEEHPFLLPAKSPLRSLYPWLAMAAMIAIGLGIWFLSSPGTNSATYLAQQYGNLNLPESVLPSRFSHTFELNRTLISRDSSQINLVLNRATSRGDSARLLLYLRKYPESLQLYQRIEDDELMDSLRFERAILHLRAKNTVLALADLERVTIEYEGGLYWYKALAYLQRSDVASAKKALSVILDLQSSPYKLDAEKLWKEL
jgi:hypothetical protein